MKNFLAKLSRSRRRRHLQKSFFAHVAARAYPCVAAKAALAHGDITVRVAGNLGDAADDARLVADLIAFARDGRQDPSRLRSFVVIFDDETARDEAAFERQLWARLQGLHEIDAQAHAWCPTVSSDVTSPEFSFSLGGEAFFVIGLHARSSRLARRFERPALVFNLHAQFDRLREAKTFERMRDQTRKRDVAFSGSVNPMVDDFGRTSEALQYSGRQVPAETRCPFTALMRKVGAA